MIASAKEKALEREKVRIASLPLGLAEAGTCLARWRAQCNTVVHSQVCDKCATNRPARPIASAYAAARSCLMSMMPQRTCAARGGGVRVLVHRQIDHVSVAHPALGNDVVGKVLHVRAASLEHGNFHAALLIEMDVQRRLG